MSHVKKVYVVTTAAIDFIPLNHDITAAIRDAGVVDGAVHIAVPKSGAALLVFENLPEVRKAITNYLAQFSKEGKLKDRLNREVELAPRLQTALLPRALSLPVVAGEVALAPYEDVILLDCDLREQRREVVIVSSGSGGGEDKKE